MRPPSLPHSRRDAPDVDYPTARCLIPNLNPWVAAACQPHCSCFSVVQLLRSCRVHRTLHPSLPSCQTPVSALHCQRSFPSLLLLSCSALKRSGLGSSVLFSLLPLSSGALPPSRPPGGGPSSGPLHPDRPIRLLASRGCKWGSIPLESSMKPMQNM